MRPPRPFLGGMNTPGQESPRSSGTAKCRSGLINNIHRCLGEFHIGLLKVLGPSAWFWWSLRDLLQKCTGKLSC